MYQSTPDILTETILEYVKFITKKNTNKELTNKLNDSASVTSKLTHKIGKIILTF
jgi:hypothetical protein